MDIDNVGVCTERTRDACDNGSPVACGQEQYLDDLANERSDTQINDRFTDCTQTSTMKDSAVIGDTGLSVAHNGYVKGRDSPDDEANNMSVDNSSCKDGSDLSDYGEENTTCQLANQAVRAKLLSSVANSVCGNESKLRVSVFDHKVIPKKFIIHKKADIKSVTSSADNVSSNRTQRPQNLNNLNNSEMDTVNQRKLSTLSYTVLKSGKIYTSDSTKSSPTSPNADAENDVRTRFDILLRNLIGDVNEMNVEATTVTPTPVTVSSGYESDYQQQNKGTETKQLPKSVTGGNSCNPITDRGKENEQPPGNRNRNNDNARGGYFSETHQANMRSASLHGSHGFSSLPVLCNSEPNMGSLKRCESRDIPLVKIAMKDSKDSQGFSYAQRHNYKLTKVTRNMYEIIHDLQNGEKPPAVDGRTKRSKKGKRSSTENYSYTDSGITSLSERSTNIRDRLQMDNKVLDNKPETRPSLKHSESVPHSFSGAVVRCVRRPLCSDSQSIQRNVSHCEPGNRLAGSAVNNNSNKVQNDLRNLLCGTTDVTGSTVDNNSLQRELSPLSGGNNTLGEFSSTSNSTFNQTGHSLVNESSADMGQRRPTLTEQFHKRSKPDDHVYETIPGDEKLYEEWKKMRKNTKIPKIRRFTTIPDLPGTFIPKEPPALPERKYLSSNHPQTTKDRDSYIFMGDVNSNFPSKVNLNNGKDSGYTSVASDKMLDSKFFQCYPYPLAEEPSLNHAGRHDETSDGYCSIDNLSLLRENFNDDTFSEPRHAPRDWRLPAHGATYPTLPHSSRNDYFLSPMSKEEYREFQNAQEQFRTEIPRVLSRQQSRDDDLGITFRVDVNKPVVQATYV